MSHLVYHLDCTTATINSSRVTNCGVVGVVSNICLSSTALGLSFLAGDSLTYLNSDSNTISRTNGATTFTNSGVIGSNSCTLSNTNAGASTQNNAWIIGSTGSTSTNGSTGSIISCINTSGLANRNSSAIGCNGTSLTLFQSTAVGLNGGTAAGNYCGFYNCVSLASGTGASTESIVLGGGSTDNASYFNSVDYLQEACLIAGGISQTITQNTNGGGANTVNRPRTVSMVGGAFNTIYGGQLSGLFGGNNHTISTAAGVTGSTSAPFYPYNTYLFGGNNHKVYNVTGCVIAGGSTHTLGTSGGSAYASNCYIFGGANNSIPDAASNSGIFGGHACTMGSVGGSQPSNCAVFGGDTNVISGGTVGCAIVGGTTNTISGTASYCFLGGQGNTMGGTQVLGFGWGRGINLTGQSGNVCLTNNDSTSFAPGGTSTMECRFTGYYYYTNSAKTTGQVLSGSAAWTGVSDARTKNVKREVLGTRDYLEKITKIPISEYHYVDDESKETNYGPVAQDFYNIYGFPVKKMKFKEERCTITGKRASKTSLEDGDDILLLSDKDQAAVFWLTLKALAEECQALRKENETIKSEMMRVMDMVVKGEKKGKQGIADDFVNI